MDAKEAIKINLDCADMICGAYLGDLTDEEAMRRPHAECNHINWQLGHLIAADNMMCNGCFAESIPALPDGFAEKYTKETASINDTAAFHSKEELMAAFETQRAGTIAALEKLSDEDLQKPSPEAMQGYAPNWATAFVMQDAHWVMHAGQWAVIRRQLGRDPLF